VQKWWSLLFGGVLLVEFLLFVISPAVGWWLPHLANRETFGKDIDFLFYVILWVTAFFFVLTEVILVVGMWRFAGEPGRRSIYVHGNHKLEMAWTLVPAAILLFIAFAQINAWADIKYTKRMTPPHHVIEVSARQFEWRMRYPDTKTRQEMTAVWTEGQKPGDSKWSEEASKRAEKWGQDMTGYSTDFHTVNEVHTWAGANTRIYLKSRDVLHSFFLPHMRLKQDAVPGKVIEVWFRPDGDAYNGEWIKGKGWQYVQEDGHDKVWDLACAELCGWGHYKMQGRLYVHKNKQSYDDWLGDAIKKQHDRDDGRKK
jgi:cytochrome c oxidase subunit 2